MGAVRTHIRFGAVLALLALALQLGLSFGHFHRIAAPLTAVADVVADAAGGHGHPSPDGLLPDDCDICATIVMAGTVLHAQPPALPVPVAFAPAEAPAGETVAPRATSFAAFRSRAPPTA